MSNPTLLQSSKTLHSSPQPITNSRTTLSHSPLILENRASTTESLQSRSDNNINQIHNLHVPSPHTQNSSFNIAHAATPTDNASFATLSKANQSLFHLGRTEMLSQLPESRSIPTLNPSENSFTTGTIDESYSESTVSITKTNSEKHLDLHTKEAFFRHVRYLKRFRGKFSPRFKNVTQGYLSIITNFIFSFVFVFLTYEQSSVFYIYMFNILANFIFFLGLCFGSITIIEVVVFLLLISIILLIILSILHFAHFNKTITQNLSIGFGSIEIIMVLACIWSFIQSLMIFYYPDTSSEYVACFNINCDSSIEVSERKKNKADWPEICKTFFYFVFRCQ